MYKRQDMCLARQFFMRIGNNTKIVLVGDPDQLQSVGAGDVFSQLINSGLIPVTVLDKIFRQKDGSRIALNARAINNDPVSYTHLRSPHRAYFGTPFPPKLYSEPFQKARLI